ncbi:MAG: cAMP/cGMP-dependent 3',5'-cyclic-AMP/GMP phosphodiesterase [Spirochaetales bacterium]|nr:cAMP/cGMP-dependent 3',5'-cyclic-AMP/GMP phosphodiesterase [Spirochaetales bacterium]
MASDKNSNRRDMESLTELTELVTVLPRGGYLVQSPVGYIQFGAPPETIKDTMGLPLSVPQIFVLPGELFHRQKGISIAELEFPIYYNFFIRKKRTTIIGTRPQIAKLIRTLNEAIFGPKDVTLSKDVHPSRKDVLIPDIRKEMKYFGGAFTFKDLVGLGYLHNNRFSYENVDITIDDDRDFDVYFDDKKVAHIPGMIEYKPKFRIGKRLPEPYNPPLFGVTCLGPSHGFDPKENTSGYIIWLNHNGVMVDPPVDSTEWLENSNVNPKLIDSIILTHCHADHDAGTFQKIMEEGKITIYATHTVINSFLRKYAALSDEPVTYLSQLFMYHPIYLGQPVFIHGGEFNFFYTLHSIPTIGFTLKFQDQSFVYSSDHQGDPEVHKELLKLGVINKARYEQLKDFPWDSKVIYHESGIPPLHTPIKYLNSLPKDVQKRIVVYHIATKDFPEKTDLTLATFGIENTLYFKTKPPQYEKMYQILGLLKHLDFFDSLPVTKVQEFVSIIVEETFLKGTKIIEKGTMGDKFYIISSGNVAIESEELVTKKLASTYEYFGEMTLMTDKPRAADVIAETDVVVYTIEKNKFLSFISNTEFEVTLQRLVENRENVIWNVLQASPIFTRLSSYQKTWIESILQPAAYEGKGVLLEEGKLMDNVFVISEGDVFVTQHGRVITTLGKGDFIGAMHKIQRKEPADYTFTYKDKISLLVIKKDDVLEFVNKNPGVGMMFTYDYCKGKQC